MNQKSSQKGLAAAFARRAQRLAKKSLLHPNKETSALLARQSEKMSSKSTALYLTARCAS